MIQSQILQTNILRIAWQMLRRIASEILGVKDFIFLILVGSRNIIELLDLTLLQKMQLKKIIFVIFNVLISHPLRYQKATLF